MSTKLLTPSHGVPEGLMLADSRAGLVPDPHSTALLEIWYRATRTRTALCGGEKQKRPKGKQLDRMLFIPKRVLALNKLDRSPTDSAPLLREVWGGDGMGPVRRVLGACLACDPEAPGAAARAPEVVGSAFQGGRGGS